MEYQYRGRKVVIAFKNLKDILDLTIKWENKLKDFYDVAEFAFQNEESKRVIGILRENLLKRLGVLKGINIDDYGKTAWIRFASDYKDDELIPIRKISRDSVPKDIFMKILDYETKLRDFYAGIHNKLVTDKQRELFESLVNFKNEQIFEINKFMEGYLS